MTLAHKHKQTYPNIKKLIKEAIEAATWRGHELGKFEHGVMNSYPGGKYAYAECIYCSKWVQCEENPSPNSIDIGGPAIAVGCKERIEN